MVDSQYGYQKSWTIHSLAWMRSDNAVMVTSNSINSMLLGLQVQGTRVLLIYLSSSDDGISSVKSMSGDVS